MALRKPFHEPRIFGDLGGNERKVSLALAGDDL
jgi:hypothetical protein